MAKNKLKPLRPSMKERQRYIQFRIVSDGVCTAGAVQNAITKELFQLYGSSGMADCGMQYLTECYSDNKGIVRVNHTFVDATKAGLALVRTIDGNPAIIQSVKTSGTLKKLR